MRSRYEERMAFVSCLIIIMLSLLRNSLLRNMIYQYVSRKWKLVYFSFQFFDNPLWPGTEWIFFILTVPIGLFAVSLLDVTALYLPKVECRGVYELHFQFYKWNGPKEWQKCGLVPIKLVQEFFIGFDTLLQARNSRYFFICHDASVIPTQIDVIEAGQ